MGKVTIKHYLNKSIATKEPKYPLYVQIIANRNNYKMKCDFPFGDGFFSDNDLQSPLLQEFIKKDAERLNSMLSYLLDNDLTIYISAEYIRLFSMNIAQVYTEKFAFLIDAEDKHAPETFHDLEIESLLEIIDYAGSDSTYSQYYHDCKNLFDVTRLKGNADMMNISVFDYLFNQAVRERFLRELNSGSRNIDGENTLRSVDKFILEK